MGWIHRLRRLTRGDRSLLLKAALWLGVTRLALRALPLPVVRRWLAHAARSPQRPPAPRPSQERIVWAVATAQRIVPRTTCLPQALVAHALLARHGYAAELRIGVLKPGLDRLLAHAWVECDGRVVVGDLSDLSRYTSLPPLPGPTP